jgi:hypothetical protein
MGWRLLERPWALFTRIQISGRLYVLIAPIDAFSFFLPTYSGSEVAHSLVRVPASEADIVLVHFVDLLVELGKALEAIRDRIALLDQLGHYVATGILGPAVSAHGCRFPFLQAV